jgi:hypothetical protein
MGRTAGHITRWGIGSPLWADASFGGKSPAGTNSGRSTQSARDAAAHSGAPPTHRYRAARYGPRGANGHEQGLLCHGRTFRVPFVAGHSNKQPNLNELGDGIETGCRHLVSWPRSIEITSGVLP